MAVVILGNDHHVSCDAEESLCHSHPGFDCYHSHAAFRHAEVQKRWLWSLRRRNGYNKLSRHEPISQVRWMGIKVFNPLLDGSALRQPKGR